MLKLYGFSVSNYYNMVKLALLEKGLPFEEVPFYAGQTPEALAVSPRGKVPVLGVKQGFINETSVILEYIEHTQEGPALLPAEPFQRAQVLALCREIELYIEQTQSGPALLPGDAFQRAQVLALCREIELYIELPARACYGEAFFGMTVPQAIKDKARAELLLGIASLGRHGKFAPYVAGESFTLADLYFMYSVDLACAVGGKLFGLDLLAELPKAKALLKKLQDLPNARRVAADKEAAMPAFMAMVAAKKS